jgi:hypothetical protein
MPAKRAYGMDQEFYSWSPIVTRPILKWPEGARVALAVIVNLEYWDWEVPEGTPLAVSPMGGPEGIWTGNQPSFPDIGGYGNHEYGNRVGVFRILAVLDKYGITPTLALDKTVADHYPFLVKEGQRRGAEFIAHYIHLHGRRTINEVNLLWREWFDGLYADGATTGRLMVLHLHPWIMGQPWRIRHLDEVLGHISAHAGVWKATGGEIIDWFKTHAG